MSTTVLADSDLVLKAALNSLASILIDRSIQPMRRRKPKSEETFGRRLARIRKARGLTQPELAKKIGISGRMLAYYEAQTEHVPAHLLDRLTKVLQVSTDEMLGLKPVHAPEPPTNLRLWRRVRILERLSPADRRAIVRQIEAMARQSGIEVTDDDDGD